MTTPAEPARVRSRPNPDVLRRRGAPDQYAEATEQDLGDTLSLPEVRATPRSQLYSPNLGNMALDRVSSQAVPIRAGSEKLDVEVSVVWKLR